MKIQVKKTKYPDDFLASIEKSLKKGVKSQITNIEDMIITAVYANGRPIGRFRFRLIDDTCKLEYKLIIEKDFYPLENIVYNLVKWLKRKKIKYILF
jgi:hypothetical protein